MREGHISDKYAMLKSVLGDMGSILLAYSGGTDSTFLLKVASEVLKDKAVAVTAESPARQERDLARARKLAEEFGVEHIVLPSRELEDENVSNNTRDRCYFCKKGLFSELASLALEMKIDYVADGSNRDDLECYRPGRKALEELRVRSPLVEADLNKDEIRELSKELGLETWDISSESCYLTRFPYDTKVGIGDLQRVAQAEDLIADMGFREVRVRVSGSSARIEVNKEQVPALEGEAMGKVSSHLRSLGFTDITVDPAGYRTGSMDEE